MFTNQEEALEQVHIAEALDRLEKDEDFKKIILEGYCKEYANGLVTYLAYGATEKQLEERYAKLRAVSIFRAFIAGIHAEGLRAKEALDNPSVFETEETAE